MSNLNKLVANRQLCNKLITAGINCSSVFYHVNRSGIWSITNGQNQFKIDENVRPAWTKQEIDLMIGPLLHKPDLLANWELPKGGSIFEYYFYYPKGHTSSMSGPDASAMLLISGIDTGLIDPLTCVVRYNAHFS